MIGRGGPKPGERNVATSQSFDFIMDIPIFVQFLGRDLHSPRRTRRNHKTTGTADEHRSPLEDRGERIEDRKNPEEDLLLTSSFSLLPSHF
jgi:hypothetical protein